MNGINIELDNLNESTPLKEAAATDESTALDNTNDDNDENKSTAFNSIASNELKELGMHSPSETDEDEGDDEDHVKKPLMGKLSATATLGHVEMTELNEITGANDDDPLSDATLIQETNVDDEDVAAAAAAANLLGSPGKDTEQKKKKRLRNYLLPEELIRNPYVRLLKPTWLKLVYVLIMLAFVFLMVFLPFCIRTVEYQNVSFLKRTNTLNN
jgi:hypothetical protein